ncbi:putative mitochondrial folate carrier protein Flx1 [Dissophora ornata]|nr:putative mitochondrial folate carrier protein Flx1 [Dissophora ornata]
MPKSYTGSVATDQALAGFTGGAVSTICLHPLDLIKTRFQVNASQSSPRIGGTLRSFQQIFRNEGFRHGLYRGLTPNFAGATVSWGLYFYLYAGIKAKMPVDPNTGRLGPGQHMTASMLGGAMTAVVTNPFWVIKTRMCTTKKTDPGAYRSLVGGLVTLVKTEGIKGLYRGIVPALFGVSHGAVQFVAYEQLKYWRQEVKRKNWEKHFLEEIHGKSSALISVEYLCMAASSKVAATVATYPYQVLRSRLQMMSNPQSGVVYTGVIDCVRKIKRAEGLLGFYKGVAPNVIRVLPGTCITFLVYETVSAWCRKHARYGAHKEQRRLAPPKRICAAPLSVQWI